MAHAARNLAPRCVVARRVPSHALPLPFLDFVEEQASDGTPIRTAIYAPAHSQAKLIEQLRKSPKTFNIHFLISLYFKERSMHQPIPIEFLITNSRCIYYTCRQGTSLFN